MKNLKKLILSLFVALVIFMDAYPVLSATEVTKKQEGEVVNGEFYKDGEKISPEELDALLQEADIDIEYREPSKKSRSIALLAPFAGTSFALAGFGMITISAAGYITYKGLKITTGWVVRSVKRYFVNEREKLLKKIPSSVRKGNYINLKSCKDPSNEKKTAASGLRRDFNCPGGWKLKRDISNVRHGGSNWKLFKGKKRIATIRSDGYILRK